MKNKRIPVISSLGVDATGQTYNENADSAFGFAVKFLKPDKAISLTPARGVIKGGEIISEMNYDELLDIMYSEHVGGGMRPKLEDVAELVKLCFDAQITSPEHLIPELFTEMGSGTYIKGLDSQ